MQDITSSLISKFVSEIGEMQNRLNELEEIKVELEEELGQLKCLKEESHVMKASLEEQLANSGSTRTSDRKWINKVEPKHREKTIYSTQIFEQRLE